MGNPDAGYIKMNKWSLSAPLSLAYGGIIQLRNIAYDLHYLKSYKADSFVISIGNISAGGSGKTPVTIDLLKRINKIFPQYPSTVISRGFGRTSSGVQIVADRESIILDVDAGGDEPHLIAKESPGTPVIVAEHRIDGVRLAEKQFAARIVVLDDAFQHRSLLRDLDIVLLNESAPAWTWQLLPSGRMREPASSLERADLMICTGIPNRAMKEKIINWICKYNDSVPVIHGCLSPAELSSPDSGERMPLATLEGLPVAALCGIAFPERFFRMLRKLGANIVAQKMLPDHARITGQQLITFNESAKKAGAEAILITAKDAVKLPLLLDASLPIWSLETKWKWLEGLELLEQIIKSRVEAHYSFKS